MQMQRLQSLALSLALGVGSFSQASFAQEDEAKKNPDAAVEPSGERSPEPEPAAAAPVKKAPARAANEAMDDSSDAARLQSLADVVARYEKLAEDYRQEVLSIAERKYIERKKKLEISYKRALDPLFAEERQNRLDAIAAFERFLLRYPNNATYTPDAIFRLAELYFEKYDDDHQKRMALFRDEFAAWQAKDDDSIEAPEEPTPKFERTVELYKELVAKFPDYRLIDGAYYLLGYTQRIQGDEEEGLASWMTLVNNYPESRFYSEVWFRVGDYQFDEEEWQKAIAAFQQVVPVKDSPFYDKALYKLAWTHYLVNNFDRSVERFFELLDFSEQQRKKTGDENEGSVLEEESLQYVAISFADDNWSRPNQYKKLISGESFEDEFADVEIDYVGYAVDYFKKSGAKEYEREVLARLGDILFKQSKNLQAIKGLRAAIAKDPLHREAPKLQDLIVQAYEREREFDKASAERDILIANYSEGTDWAGKHFSDSDARKEARDLAKTSLYKAAIYYHQQANKYFEDNKQDLGVKAFQAASQSYRQYLERYPHDREAYELTFYLGETYYYSLQFREAATIYARVRDSTQGTKYRNEAALNVVYALDKVVQQKVKSGELPEKDPFKKVEGAENKLVDRVEIDPLRQEYLGAIDALLKGTPPPKVAANFGYTAAAIYYTHGQYDEAIRRFNKVIDNHPNEEAARFSGNLILNYLLAKQDYEKAAVVAARLEKSITSGDNSEFKKIGSGAKFQLAKRTLEEGDKALKEGRVAEGIAKLEQGASEYLALLEEDPKREFADLMMYNAALSLEKARRPARAAELYERLYKEYPKSAYAAQAMFNVASKSEQAFAFDRAIKTYRELVKRYPESDLRADAQINSALALEGQQRYVDAAREFERFASLFPDRPEAPEVFFRAALVHRKNKDASSEIKTLQSFIKRYKNDRAQVARVVESNVRIGDIRNSQAEQSKKSSTRRSKERSAKSSYEAAVSQFGRSPDSKEAAYFAGKAAFQLAEYDYASYDKMTIKANAGKTQGKELLAKSKKLTEVEKSFRDVITRYKQAEWSLASLFRLGSLYDDLQQTIINAPCPKDIRRIDEIACDEYANVLEDKAFAVEEKAVEAYRTAYERARELKINNQWTRRTLEALNRLRPEFAIDKEPIGEAAYGEVYNLGYVLPDGGAALMKEGAQ